jgi:DNA-binding MarR family transcriptional regulator
MNLDGENSPPAPVEQAERLKELIAGIVDCCQSRTVHEARLLDLAPAEARCLLLFGPGEYRTAVRLAEEMEVRKSRITKIVQGLMEKGLVASLPDPRDGRVKLLYLTREGRRRLAEAEAFLTAVHGRVLNQVPAARRAEVLGALESLLASMLAVKSEMGIP